MNIIRYPGRQCIALCGQYKAPDNSGVEGEVDMDLSIPTLSCRKRAPPRLEIGKATPEYSSTVQDHYRRTYFEVIDFLLAAIQESSSRKDF